MAAVRIAIIIIIIIGDLILSAVSEECKPAHPALVIDTMVRFVRPCEYDVLLNDITEDDLHLIAEMDGMSYLGMSPITMPEFPVDGTIIGGHKRFMVNLLVRRRRAREYRNVVFMVDTGSPYTFLSRSAMEAVTGSGADNLPAALKLEIHGNQSMVCYMSPPDKHFADINLLGTDFLELNGAQIHVDWAQRTFLLDSKN